ncbi:MAG: lytic transglycosylase domain-containing protein [Oscillospiraceae bacterium]|nr:lytic transglycosylase domain-containing protein [Oscillospiraceae bacterium]
MRKKLGSFLLIVFLGALVFGIFNIENICKKYIYPIEYGKYVEEAAYKTGVDNYLIYAVIKTESNFNTDATSDVGARGLMQLMEDAYEWVKFRMNDESDISYDDMYDPYYNIKYGSYLLKLLYDEYGDVETAVAAYHSGRGSVNEWLKNEAYSSDGKTLDKIPSDTTAHYVSKVMKAYNAYTNLYEQNK